MTQPAPDMECLGPLARGRHMSKEDTADEMLDVAEIIQLQA